MPYLLMVSSSSESPRLVLSSSLVMSVEELSYPARWRSSLEGPPGLWPPAEHEQEPQEATPHSPRRSPPQAPGGPASSGPTPLTATLTAVSPARPVPPQRHH